MLRTSKGTMASASRGARAWGPLTRHRLPDGARALLGAEGAARSVPEGTTPLRLEAVDLLVVAAAQGEAAGLARELSAPADLVWVRTAQDGVGRAETEVLL